MTIVCGTDFSAPAAGAVRVAALLATKLDEPLKIVHVLDELGAEVTLRNQGQLFNPVRTRLRAVAKRARDLGAEVTEALVPGSTADVLVAVAEQTDARIIVVSSLGERAPARWLLGSTAERVSRASPVPVLVVRDSVPFERWLANEASLDVTVGADTSESSDAALRWAAELCRMGPCDVTVAHVACPAAEHDRLGVTAPAELEHLHPDVERTIVRDLKAKARAASFDEDAFRVLVRQGTGRTDQHLVSLAEEAAAHLLVVGSHQRSRIERLWHGSVSRGAVHLSPMSVATIPRPSETAADQRRVPTLERVLVGTDFSDAGNRALLHAVSLLPGGGTVHFVHVLTPAMERTPVMELVTTLGLSAEEWRSEVEAAQDHLNRLVPPDTDAKGVRVLIDVLEGSAADELCRASERLRADLICVGSHGRSRLAAAILGSVAQSVIAKARRPVLVVPPPEE
jgi:nucleotide-binding universal stress UspA family protein